MTQTSRLEHAHFIDNREFHRISGEEDLTMEFYHRNASGALTAKWAANHRHISLTSHLCPSLVVHHHREAIVTAARMTTLCHDIGRGLLQATDTQQRYVMLRFRVVMLRFRVVTLHVAHE